MSLHSNIRLFDALYGEIILTGPLADLLCIPAIQRLRRIRLSNIDSLTMPGIANISRYEHAIGAAYLASRIGFSQRLNRFDALVLQAAAMLHDVAITPFGHLMEEALQYVSASFNHEIKLSMLFQNTGDGELGGINLQIYAGRESGIRSWAERTFQAEADDRLRMITNALFGKGKFGRCIAGDVDLDNLDNLTRIAFHMGIDVDRELPTRIASKIVANNEVGGPIFASGSANDLEKWLNLRWTVYNRLMLSQEDFAGKVMLIYAIVTAYKRGDLEPVKYAWTLTDDALFQHLLQSEDAEVRRTIHSWMVHDLWPLSDLFWMQGKVPDYANVHDFSEHASEIVNRPCFAYAIRDKRVRLLEVHLESGELIKLGTAPDQWVLGIASRKREEFSANENRQLQETAAEFFNTSCLGKVREDTADMPSLFE